ncbi:MAG TPA: hypothetical protein VN428_02050 [Bryobacteraceae bacterium]|nr:hypothetical protein [Bryobacteraceae bacterium]
MRTSVLGMMLAGAFVVAGPAIGDDHAKATRHQSTTATEAERQTADMNRGATAHGEKGDVTYGRIKEMTAGKKVVIDVDNQIDKNFDLTDKDTKVTMAGTLKVGDPVKVTEVDHDGQKMVTIARNDNPNVKHGDQTAADVKGHRREGVRTDEAVGAAGEHDVTYGRIKEMSAGRKVVIDTDNNIDKNYDLTDKDTKVTLAGKLKVGDPVKVTESDHAGQKVVTISRHNDPSVKHGDRSAAETQRDVRTDEARDVKDAGKAAKNAGKSAGRATKEAGRDVKDAAKDMKDDH